MSGGMARLVVLGALLVPPAAGLGAPAVWAQEAQPMSHAEFISLLQQETPVEEIIAQVKARGINFKVTPRLEEELDILEVKGKERRALLAVLSEPATLELQTNVAGAAVTLDGRPQEPLSAEGSIVFSALEAGSHRVRLEHKDYVRENLDVFLKPGESRRIELELQLAVTLAPGPLGTQVSVAAGTPIDTALVELEFARTPQKRIPLLRRFVAQFAGSPVVLLGWRMLQETYMEQEQYDLVVAAGNEILKRDPTDFTARARSAQAYAKNGEVAEAFRVTQEARELVQAAQTAPAPEGTDPATWETRREELVRDAEGKLAGLAYVLFVGATGMQDLAQRRGLLEQFVAVFPQSPYLEASYFWLAVSAQQQRDFAGALQWAERGLEANPDQGALMVLVADILSEQGENLERARELASRLVATLENEPEKLRPQGMGDEDWAPRQQLWRGTGHSILGQVLMYEETAQKPRQMDKTRQAVAEFQKASPLLQPETNSYARNLYRLGFAYAKLGERANARRVLQELMSLETPYRQVAAPLLEKVK